MATVRVNKKFVVNMGNYESYSPEFSIELPIEEGQTLAVAMHVASQLVDAAAFADLTEAAETTDVHNSYILTWLNNRKEEPYANTTKN